MSEELVWIFDAVSGFLKGPEWGVPVWGFIDDNCIVFDSEDENKLAYIDIFNAFREMVENLLEMHLEEFGVTMDQFVTLCTEHSSSEVGKEILEQILAVDDFVSFKQMMVKRNMELELESLKELQVLSITHTRTHAHTHTPAHTYQRMHTSACIPTHITRAHTRMHGCVHRRMHAHMHAGALGQARGRRRSAAAGG